MDLKCLICGGHSALCSCVKTEMQLIFRLGRFREYLSNLADEVRHPPDADSAAYCEAKYDGFIEVIEEFDRYFESIL